MNKKDYLIKRLSRIRELMTEVEIDILIVSNKENKYYLSGFTSSNYFIVVTHNKEYLLTDFRYIESASSLADLFEIVKLTSENNIIDFVSSINGKTIGIEYEFENVNFFKQIENTCKEKEIVNSDGLVQMLRTVKDENELDNIRSAAAIADRAFSYICDYIVPGASERELALKLEFFLRENGASGLSFDTIMISGKKTSLPHGIPDDSIIQQGDFVTMDFGCVYNGYCSDMTRTVAVGKISEEQINIYNIVLEAQLAGCEYIRAGVKAKEADNAARKIISDAGYGDYFGHSLGHGVGLEIHEAPNLSPLNDAVLLKNSIVTIEPGIYLPSKFGVRIEDMAIVTDKSIENLCKSSKKLIYTC